VQFASRIRGMAAFDGIEALKAQMADDVARVRFALS
jgi:riboflavin kinase/FMN adenylyltransferase